MKNNNIHKILVKTNHYLKKAAQCKQKKVIQANRFAEQYCQPHLIRKPMRQIVSSLIGPPRFSNKTEPSQNRYFNQITAEINVKQNEIYLLKLIQASQNNELVYTNYSLGLLNAASMLGFKAKTDIYRNIHSHNFKQAIKSLAVDTSLQEQSKTDPKIIPFPTQIAKH